MRGAEHGFWGRAIGLTVVGTLVLLIGSCGGGGWRADLSTSTEIRAEASEPEAPLPGPEDIPRLIDDLRDDDVILNAWFAQSHLVRLGAQAIPALETALDSDDHQQRQSAAVVLRRIVKTLAITPPYRLIEVSVEGLADDQFHDYQVGNNAREGRLFLDTHMEQATGCLLDALGSEDRQQRFISAYLLATNRVEERVNETCSILIGHLADNDIGGDAAHSCFALARLGRSALPFLRPRLDSADPQQRSSVNLIIMAIESPPKTKAELQARRELHALTSIVFDPSLERSPHNFSGLGNHATWRLFSGFWYKGKGPISSLVELQKQHGDKLVYKFDRKKLDFLQVAVGLRKVNFDRLLTLRIYPEGTVDRRITDEDGSVRWKVVYRP